MPAESASLGHCQCLQFLTSRAMTSVASDPVWAMTWDHQVLWFVLVWAAVRATPGTVWATARAGEADGMWSVEAD